LRDMRVVPQQAGFELLVSAEKLRSQRHGMYPSAGATAKFPWKNTLKYAFMGTGPV
jgi:hypothetical protein